jgi:hypothetical protein
MTKSRDLANAATALNAVTAAELTYVDGVTSAIQTQIDTKLASATAATTYVANSLADAKGDIFVATADNTVTRLPVGNSGEQIVADSSTSTGLRYQVPVNANPFLNGAMQIAQRGTSFASSTLSSAAASYTLDRWMAFRSSFTSGATVSRQATGDTTNLPFIQYCIRVARDSGNTSTNALWLSQSIESLNSIPYAGKTVNFSFYARAGANYSSASSALSVVLQSGTGTDQNIIQTWTGGSNIVSQTATLTTTWQRFTYTGSVPSTATELGLYFTETPVGTAGAADYFEVTGVQLEVGSVATPFKTNGATIQGELSACQRYYTRLNTGTTTFIGQGQVRNGTVFSLFGSIPLPVSMRTVPSLSANLLFAEVNSGGGQNLTTIFASASTNNAGFYAQSPGNYSGDVGAILRGQGSTSYLEASAEL